MKERKTSHKKEESSNQTLMVWILVIVVLQFLLLGFLITQVSNVGDSSLDDVSEKVTRLDSFFASNAPGYGSGNAQAPQRNNQQENDYVDVSKINLEGEPRLGNADAKVTVIEFSDYECPFCARFYTETYSQLKKDFIDTGKINFVFKDFPLSFHENAKPAAIAASCVYNQLGDEAYFKFHDKVFENQKSLNEDNYKMWAKEIGVDLDKYSSCLIDESVADEVDGDLVEGSAVGVTGTPSFVINGKLVVGAQPYGVLKAEIESALAQ